MTPYQKQIEEVKRQRGKTACGSAESKGKNILPLYELFGVRFPSVNGNQNVRAEECPFCGGDRFYVNMETGQYVCHQANNCGEKGNAYTFIRWVHATALEQTTDTHYRLLKDKRGWPLQTLKRHGFAWHDLLGCWLLPSKSSNGEVLNLLRYDPESGKKLALPVLLLTLYGLDMLSEEKRTLFLCEGAFDAIALDEHMTSNKARKRYDILAVPSANVFKEKWLEHFQGRTVRLVFDNDEAGRKGQERITNLCREHKTDCKLYALHWPDDTPEGCKDVDDLVKGGVNVVDFTREHCVKVGERERRLLFVQGDAIPEEKTEWLWDRHVPFGSFVSLSGEQGTGKSTVSRDIAARCTAGLPMPGCTQGIEPFNVLLFTSEDGASRVRDIVALHDGDINRLYVHDILTGPDPINVLACLDELEAEINAGQARLVIIDAINSFVDADISTDSRARRTLVAPLHALARRTGACIIGIRNFGRTVLGSASQKALGAVSLSHMARCVLNTREIVSDKVPYQYLLEFEKVSDAPKPKAIGYNVLDESGGNKDRSHLRRIVWLPEQARETRAMLMDSLNKKRKSGNNG